MEENRVPIVVNFKQPESWGGAITQLASNNTFRPGDRIVISFVRHDNNPVIRYNVNGGNWSDYLPVGSNNGTRVTERIYLTVPSNVLTVNIEDGWNQLVGLKEFVSIKANDSVSTTSTQTVAKAAASAKLDTARLRAAGTGPYADNTGLMPVPTDNTKRYEPDS